MDLLKVIEKLNIDINNEPNKTTNVAPIVLFKKEKSIYYQYHHLLIIFSHIIKKFYIKC